MSQENVELSREKLALLRRSYEAFNGRDIEAALAGMDRDVEWPNVMEGITIRGHDAVRDYWTKQFRVIESRVDPERFIEAGSLFFNDKNFNLSGKISNSYIILLALLY